MIKPSSTIYDIAKAVNTSPSTVSRVLSHSGYPVNKKLKAEIERIAMELNYVPNLMGRQLKKKVSLTLGIIIPSISNPYYSAVVLGVEEVARSKGYNVLLCNSQQSVKLEEQYLQMLLEKQVAGLIISSVSKDHRMVDKYTKAGLNVVALDQLLNNNVYQIDFDYEKGGYMATSHLIENGHKKIAYLTAPFDRRSRELIYKGYKQALLDQGITPDEKWLVVSESSGEESYDRSYEFNDGRKLARRLLALPDLPTAVFVCNDMTAFGVLNELVSHGIKVPKEISLVGFDNIDIGEMITPRLTTIEQPNSESGKMACNILFDSIEGRTTSPYKIVLQPRLIERNSVFNRKREKI